MNTIAFSVILALRDFATALLTVQESYEWGWRMHPMLGWGWGVGMMAMMLTFWAVVIVVAVLGMRWFIGQTKSARGDSALEILRQRFARGEIEKDEFEAKKKQLS
jgi:putative membrane protein